MQVPIYSRINAPTLPLKDLEAALLDNLDEEMIATLSADHGELCVKVKPEYLLEMARILRDTPTLDFQQLIDITAVDHPERRPRFEVVYHLLSIGLNQRLRVKVLTDDTSPVSSVISVWPNANWYEREIWDMFGISFQNHPDLRRLLTDYGFDGHPLRKDFPVTGRVEMRYDNQKGRIVQEAVNLKQAFRNFETISPWKGLNFKAKQNPEEEDASEEDPAEKQDKKGSSNG